MQTKKRRSIRLLRLAIILPLLLVATFAMSSTINGQDNENAVARLATNGGKCTCFAVALAENEVELWTAGHCVGPVGSNATITWSTGEQTIARVEYRAYSDRHDEAKLVGNRPHHKVDVVRITNGLPDGFVSGYHIGYDRCGQKSAKKVQADPRKFDGYITAKPACIGGDSGGPLFNQKGECIAVVTKRTKEVLPQRRILLAVPISSWTNAD